MYNEYVMKGKIRNHLKYLATDRLNIMLGDFAPNEVTRIYHDLYLNPLFQP